MKLKVNFQLKATDTDVAPILAMISFGYAEYDVMKQKRIYKPLKYYTGLKIERYKWDSDLGLPNDRKIQTQLSVMEKTIRDCYDLFKLKGEEITPDKLKVELDIKIKGKVQEDKLRIRIVDYIERYIEDAEDLSRKTKGNYKSFKNRIIELETKIGKPVYAHEVNEDIFKIFLSMMRERTNKINSVWSAKKDFVSILNKIAHRYKIKVFQANTELEKKDKVSMAKVEKVSFNFEQIQKIIDHRPEDEKMKNVKLILLTLIFTGCRYSDVFKIHPEVLYENESISFYYTQFLTQKSTSKGRKNVLIPLLKPLMDSINENGGKTAQRMYEKDFNDLARQLISACGIIEQRKLTYTDSNGKLQYETKAFNEFVSSHIGRRSFVSNLKNFIPFPILAKITGHEYSARDGELKIDSKSAIFLYDHETLIENAAVFMQLLKYSCTNFKNLIRIDLV